MDLNKLQKKVDRALSVLSDHDDKKEEQRYINLRNKIEEVQEYINKGLNYSDISLEMYNELKKCIREFEEDKFIFIIFLIILCGLLFIGVFYITYSHFHDHFHPYPGGDIKPPHHTKPTKPTKPTSKTSTTLTTTKVSEKTTDKTTSTTDKITTSIDKTQTTTTPIKDDEEFDAFVTLIFDNSNLVDLKNLYPMQDSIGLTTKPTTWSLRSSLINSSKDYILTYYVDFIDDFGEENDEDYISPDERLDINKLKYQLLIKKGNQIIYDTEIQDMYDYPEAEEGIRPIITAQTMNNDQNLDFELRMWLDSSAGNDQQGKKYRKEKSQNPIGI